MINYNELEALRDQLSLVKQNPDYKDLTLEEQTAIAIKELAILKTQLDEANRKARLEAETEPTFYFKANQHTIEVFMNFNIEESKYRNLICEVKDYLLNEGKYNPNTTLLSERIGITTLNTLLLNASIRGAK